MAVKLDWDGKQSVFYRPKNIPLQTVEVIKSGRAKRRAEETKGYDLEDMMKTKDDDSNWKNKLIWGDNKTAMCSLLDSGYRGKIDLIYIDPPFAVGANFGFTVDIGDEELEKEQSFIEELAYKDTWGKGIDTYLQYMYERLVLMRDLLSDSGSIYVHCDYRVNSYLRLILDSIFGKENFKNEIYVSRIKKNVSEYEKAISLNTDLDSIFLFGKSETSKISPPKKDKLKEPRWHSFEASGVRNGMDYDLFGFKPKLGNHWRWSLERATKAIEEGILRKNPKTGKPEYLVTKEFEIYGTNWSDLTAYSFNFNYPTEKSMNLLDRIINASSNEDSIIADFFCGSGTTSAVAEKLGRKWIACDLGRYAIHTTRKRIMNIENHKPFEVVNVGQYERQIWQGFKAEEKEKRYREHIDFILKFYGAEKVSGHRYINGKKGNTFVVVGEIDSPVNISFIQEVIKECKENNVNVIDILAWEYILGIEDEIPAILTAFGMEGKLKINRKVIPNEILDNKLREQGLVKFYDACYVELNSKINGKTVSIEIKDFIFPFGNLSDKSRKAIEENKKLTKFDFIDYWSIDWDYDGEIFNNQWQEYRTKKEKTLKTVASNTYEKAGEYNILVKVIDVLGNDTSQMIKVKIGG